MIQDQLKQQLKGIAKPHLLLACSGGVDSMLLLYFLQQSNYPFAIAHCNFMLRETESDQDANFVATYCNSYKLPYFEQSFQTKTYAASKGISTQMAARTLRYQWFDTLKDTEGFTHILTAHHLDDQLETFLINLGRGTGLKGLTGIPTNSILRPLLNISKEEILTFAHANNVQWREDSSNTSLDYLRNQLRHQVIPQWKAIQPNISQQLEKTQQQLMWAAEALAVQCKVFKSRHFKTTQVGFSIAIDELKKLHPLEYYLHALFSSYGFSHHSDLNDLLKAQSGKQLFSNSHRLIKDRTDLLLVPKDTKQKIENYTWSPTEDLNYPISLKVGEISTKRQKTAVLDVDQLKYPLILRKYEEGDYFYPVGMKGKKKLSKFFKDQKYSLPEKEKQWLLCSDNAIVWVIGQRLDARFAATAKTHNPLIVTCD